MKCLSIIIPVYNGESFLEQLIKNIVEQNSPTNLEYDVILINDGSKDNTETVILSLLEEYPFIKYIKQKNGGIAAARNAGLANAEGKYVTFIDQDDSLVGGYFSFVKLLDESNADFLISNPTIFCDSTSIVRQVIIKDELINREDIVDLCRIVIGGQYLPKIHKKNQNRHVTNSVWNCIYRRSFIESNQIRFEKYVDFEDDWIFTVNCLNNAESVYLCAETYYCWNISETSESHRNKYISDFYNKRMQIIEWIRTKYEGLKLDNAATQSFDLLLSKRTILWGFYNECWNPDNSIEDKLETIRMITESELNKFNSKEYSLDGTKEKLLFNLLIKKHYKLAFMLNTIVFKRHFH